MEGVADRKHGRGVDSTPERVLFQQLTGGREREPLQPVEEAAFMVGRRGGKSRAISVLAAYVAALYDHPALAPGERGILLIIGPDQRQSDIVFDYIVANFREQSDPAPADREQDCTHPGG